VKGLLLFDPAPGTLTAQRFGGDFGGSGVGVHWLVVARSAVAAADDGTGAAAADVACVRHVNVCRYICTRTQMYIFTNTDVDTDTVICAYAKIH